MKKIVSILFLIALFATNLNAQSTSPRWGSGPPQNDNTGRIFTYDLTTVITGTATAISYQKLNPLVSNHIIKVGTLTHALTDSVSVSGSFVGDVLTFIFTADTLTAGRVVTFGNHFASSGTLTVPNSKSGHSGQATAVFIFDGIRYTELDRTINTN